jgi:hypothetical protein
VRLSVLGEFGMSIPLYVSAHPEISVDLRDFFDCLIFALAASAAPGTVPECYSGGGRLRARCSRRSAALRPSAKYARRTQQRCWDLCYMPQRCRGLRHDAVWPCKLLPAMRKRTPDEWTALRYLSSEYILCSKDIFLMLVNGHLAVFDMPIGAMNARTTLLVARGLRLCERRLITRKPFLRGSCRAFKSVKLSAWPRTVNWSRLINWGGYGPGGNGAGA